MPQINIEEIQAIYTAHADEARAIEMARYMKDKNPFLGLPSPLRAELFKALFDGQNTPTAEVAMSLAEQLWRLPYREYHYLAVDILRKAKAYKKEESITLFEDLLVKNSWWDSVDHINGQLLGDYFSCFPQNKDAITGKWNESQNMWLQRVSVIFQLKYKHKTDLVLLSKHILRHSDSKEFFVQKAIGWALRTVAKFNPDFVRDFVEKHPLKPLSKREAMKHLV